MIGFLEGIDFLGAIVRKLKGEEKKKRRKRRRRRRTQQKTKLRKETKERCKA